MHKKGGAGCHVYCLFVNVASCREFLNPLSPGFVAPWPKLCLHQKLHLILIKAKQLLDGVKRDLIRQSHFDYFVFVFQFKVPVFRRHSRWFHLGLYAPAGVCRYLILKKSLKPLLLFFVIFGRRSIQLCIFCQPCTAP